MINGGWKRDEGEELRRDQLPADWPKIRKRILRRDEHRCVWKLPSGARCPRHATDVDHVWSSTDHRDRNLRSLCSHHHGKRTSIQGTRARRDRYAKPGRASEPDPGALG